MFVERKLGVVRELFGRVAGLWFRDSECLLAAVGSPLDSISFGLPAYLHIRTEIDIS